MPTASLTLSFANPARPDVEDFVLLEQEPMDPFSGFLTKMGVYGFLHQELFEEEDYIGADCGWEDGKPISTTIYAYPSRSGLAYRFGLSYGSHQQAAISIADYSEVVQCNLELEPGLKYPARSVSRFAWIGDAYDKDGTLVGQPAVTIHGSGITLAEEVYGTLLVTYMVEKHSRTISISPRPDALENKYQSFAWAVWGGGNEAIEIEIPDGAESGRCNTSGSGGGTISHVPSAPDYMVSGPDETEEIKYCELEEEA